MVPTVTSRIRWLSHWHVVRQGWSFFQGDFAGRIASRVMQTAGALRESAEAAIRSCWYLLVYGATTLGLLGAADWRLALPTLAWAVAFVLYLRHYVPRLRALAAGSAAAHSTLSGRLVDTYANILTVRLFPDPRSQHAWVGDAIRDHERAMRAHMGRITGFMTTLAVLNTLLLGATAATGLALWARGDIEASAIAMALPLTWQIASMAGWVSWEVTGIFENLSSVQEGMRTIAAPPRGLDAPDAVPLTVTRGGIRFERVAFAYDGGQPVFESLDLEIRPGERVGLIGRSGAGKSTLVGLLLRLHDVRSGRILVDGQDVSRVTQDSLRAAIGVVAQDTSLLHRSIGENIRYGRPEADDPAVTAAARRARAHEFIESLRDGEGRHGYAVHVGERGVKLSGGQRQRVAIARVLLKDAPILVLDEATSALDSEVEQAIQEQLQGLMAGKTVIAIAHRLSTIAAMDRLVVLDGGRVVEEGTHGELLARDGQYAALWRRQSGGFVGGGHPAFGATPQAR
jgi:ATP-binding cassette subfamily B multidrug efflux pump